MTLTLQLSVQSGVPNCAHDFVQHISRFSCRTKALTDTFRFPLPFFWRPLLHSLFLHLFLDSIKEFLCLFSLSLTPPGLFILLNLKYIYRIPLRYKKKNPVFCNKINATTNHYDWWNKLIQKSNMFL